MTLGRFGDRGPDRYVFAGFGPFDDHQAWTTTAVAALTLRGIDRSHPLALTLVISGDRPMPPRLTLRADDAVLGERQLTNTDDRWTVLIPPRAQSGLRLEFASSDLYQPDNGDYARGVLVRAITIASDRGWWWPPRGQLSEAAMTGALVGAAFSLVELPSLVVVIAILCGAIAAAALGRLGIAGFTPWDLAAQNAAIVASAGAAVFALARRIQHGSGLARICGRLFVVTCAMLWFNLLFWLHPEMPVGDAGFHLHRFELVSRGVRFFTSAAPGGSFPYPIALYIVAGWLKEPGFLWQTGDPLRVVAAYADAIAAFAVGLVVWRRWQSSSAALLTVVAYHLIPAQFQVQAIAYLTNAFGHSMSVIAMAMLFIAPAAAGALLALPWAVTAFLSHTGTFITLAAMLVAVAAIEAMRRRADHWPRALATIALLAAAATIAVFAYYAHFGDVYRDLLHASRPAVTELPAQRAEAHQTMWVPGWLALSRRLAAVPGYLAKYWTVPLIALAAIGLWRRRRFDDALSRGLRGWLFACAALWILGQLTPIDVRYYLAASPALAAFGALAVVDGWTLPRLRVVTTILAILFVAQAVAYRLEWFGRILPR